MKRFRLVPALALLVACGDTALEPTKPVEEAAPSLSVIADVNAQLTADGSGYVLYTAEYLTTGEGGELGRTVYFSDVGDKQLSAHWVEGDVRRLGDPGGGITYIIDGIEGATTSGLTQAQTDGAIQSAMGTWDAVKCSTIPLVSLGTYSLDLGYVQWLLGFGGVPGFAADVTHAGFLPGAFFNSALGPGASANVLGVTFTFIFVDAADVPTDIDGNGKYDVAFREIYYNDNMPWHLGVTYDVETVALHEFGHGLSQAHFGSAFRTDTNDMLHFSPRALMNAAYSGVQTDVVKTDNAGHCSIWDSWGQ